MELLQRLDAHVLDWFQAHHTPSLDGFMINVTALGSTQVISLVVLFTLCLLLSLGRFRTAVWVGAASVGGMLLTRAVKVLIGRARPSTAAAIGLLAEQTPSFPSGHSMLAAVTYLTLALVVTAVIRRHLVRVYIVAATLVLVGLIGVSRLYLGAHYFTDVLGGWLIGLTWALLCRWVEFRWVLRAHGQSARKEEPPTPLPLA
jgi:undecaprenyl-diphosphatase